MRDDFEKKLWDVTKDPSGFAASRAKMHELAERVRLGEAPSQQIGDMPQQPAAAWPVMPEAAHHGLVGDIVRTFDPHTEADPAAILVSSLIMFGNMAGRRAYYQVESTVHYPCLYGVLVGATSKARKGTAIGRVRHVASGADKEWSIERIQSGLSSGEGLINAVRDPTFKNDDHGVPEEVDPGAKDKRLFVSEEEFVSSLAVMQRAGNTLSPLLRLAWDGSRLSTMTRNSPLVATEAHISIIGHITQDELRLNLTRTEIANGFANRFLFIMARRSKLLPHGGDLSDEAIGILSERLAQVLDTVPHSRIHMTKETHDRWLTDYARLSTDRPGLVGAVTARAEAQVMRLALVYALLDRSRQINIQHLDAALAVWDYCCASASYIFGDSLGNAMADEILRALRQAGTAGIAKVDIWAMFSHAKSTAQMKTALTLLLQHGLARRETKAYQGAGRPVEMWYATSDQKKVTNEDSSNN